MQQGLSYRGIRRVSRKNIDTCGSGFQAFTASPAIRLLFGGPVDDRPDSLPHQPVGSFRQDLLQIAGIDSKAVPILTIVIRDLFDRRLRLCANGKVFDVFVGVDHPQEKLRLIFGKRPGPDKGLTAAHGKQRHPDPCGSAALSSDLAFQISASLFPYPQRAQKSSSGTYLGPRTETIP